MTSALLAATLRQVLALLEGERQALAALDLDGILACQSRKLSLCDELTQAHEHAIGEQCRALLEAVKRRNEINRRTRNLLAANVDSRLAALTGGEVPYRAAPKRTAAPSHA